MNNKLKRNLIIIISCLGVIGLDQYTKIWAKAALKFQPSRIYLNDFFRFQYAENKGAFLSLGSGLSDSARFWILTILVCIVVGVGFYYLLRKHYHWYFTLGLTLILAGGVGNLIDRALYGSVVDFMNMGIGSLRTGIFNVADIAISTGGIMLLLENIIIKKKEETQDS